MTTFSRTSIMHGFWRLYVIAFVLVVLATVKVSSLVFMRCSSNEECAVLCTQNAEWKCNIAGGTGFGVCQSV